MSRYVDLREYLDKLTILKEYSSWYRCICPVCKGTKLKINRHTGTFACYDGCTAKAILMKVVPAIKRIDLFGEFANIITKSHKPQDYSEVLLNDIQLMKTTAPYNPPHKWVDSIGRHTLYVYDENNCVERIDFDDGHKTFYPKHKTRTGTWVYGRGLHNFYNKHLVTGASPSTILFVEGEKSANTAVYLGYVALTAPSFGWTRDFLVAGLRPLSNYSFLYIEDNDEPGIKKRKNFLNSAWSLNIPAGYINIAAVFGVKTKGFDIADAYTYFNKELCDYLSTISNKSLT